MEPRVEQLARRYMWWNAPAAAVADQRRLVAQVMALGTWDDAHWLLRHLGAEAFLDVLRSPPPGVLSPKAWYFWHRRLLNQSPATELSPARVLPQ